MQAPEIASERQQEAHPPSPPEHSERQEFILSPSDFRKILLKRRWVILACFLLGIMIAAVITAFTVPVYESIARVDINPAQSTNIGISDIMESKVGGDTSNRLLTQVRILQSDSVIYAVIESQNLEETEQSILKAGGKITLPIISFPGGRRFHFTDPAGNELAIMQRE